MTTIPSDRPTNTTNAKPFFIDSPRGEPDLMPASVARDIGVSTRTLERAFATHGETVMRRVFDERLRQTARQLRSPDCAHRSITDIAFACGFNDSSHFGRLFFRKMQVTPSQWRRQS